MLCSFEIIYVKLMVYVVCYDQRLRVKSIKESCIGFIQENLMECLVQNCLPYISQTVVCAHTTTILF